MPAMQEQQFIETRQISLPRGGVLEVQMTQVMINKIRQHFSLGPAQYLEDDHVRMFFWGTVNDAVSKAEQGV